MSAVVEGEVSAGKSFERVFAPGLEFLLEPIASGWMVRVLRVNEPRGPHDYAELATPPYQSVTALAISTDFSFRAQDAVGWNPRRFRFATTARNFHKLEQMYVRLIAAGTSPQPALESELASEIAQSSEGTLTIVDAKLVPGTADQGAAAAAVASHFSTTAHTLVQEPDGHTSPLGRLVWVRFRLDLDVPRGFAVNSALRVGPGACESSQ